MWPGARAGQLARSVTVPQHEARPDWTQSSLSGRHTAGQPAARGPARVFAGARSRLEPMHVRFAGRSGAAALLGCGELEPARVSLTVTRRTQTILLLPDRYYRGPDQPDSTASAALLALAADSKCQLPGCGPAVTGTVQEEAKPA